MPHFPAAGPGRDKDKDNKGRGYDKKVKGKISGGQCGGDALANAWKGEHTTDYAKMKGAFAADHRSRSVVQYSRADNAGMIKGCGKKWMAVVVTKRHLYFLSTSGFQEDNDGAGSARPSAASSPPPLQLGPAPNGASPPPSAAAFGAFSAFGTSPASAPKDAGAGAGGGGLNATPVQCHLRAADGTPMEYRARRRRNVTIAATAVNVDMIGLHIVRKKVPLTSINGVIFSTSDENSIVLDFDSASLDLWTYSIITFDQSKSRDEFVACLMTTRKRLAYESKKKDMYIDTNPEPLINVEYAKRTVSAVRLRRALDATLQQEKTRSMWIHVEDDYENAGRYTQLVELLRSNGDTSIKVSTHVEWVRERNEAEHKHPHLLIVTDTSMYLLLEERDSFRLDSGIGLHIPIERIESVTLCKNYFHFVMIRNKRSTPKSVLVRVLGSKDAQPDPIPVETAVTRIKKHLEKVYLDLKIGTKSLPLKLEKDVYVRSGFEKAIHKLSTYIENIAKWFQSNKDGAIAMQDYPTTSGSLGDNANCYKWLLAIVRYNRMFDLITTFTAINATGLRAGIDMNLQYKGRRLGLSLLGLCAHLDLSHQLMYEAILYEVISCEGSAQGYPALFVKDTFATQLIGLYLNNRADQYARLVLTDPMEKFLHITDEEALSVSEHCTLFLEAFATVENIKAIPHELGVILATIERSVIAITSEQLIAAPLDYRKCSFCFLLERLLAPAMLTPHALGITTRQPDAQQMRVLRGVVAMLKAGIGYSTWDHGGGKDGALFDSLECSSWKVENDDLINSYLASLAARGDACDIRLNDDAPARDPGGGRVDRSASNASEGVHSELARRASLLNPQSRSAAAMDDAGGDITIQKVREITDAEVKRLAPSLASVHHYLGRDTERIFVSLIVSIEKLDSAIRTVQGRIDVRKARIVQKKRRIVGLTSPTFQDVHSETEVADPRTPIMLLSPKRGQRWKRAMSKVSCAMSLSNASGRASLPSALDNFRAFGGSEASPVPSPARSRAGSPTPKLFAPGVVDLRSPVSLSQSPRAGSDSGSDHDPFAFGDRDPWGGHDHDGDTSMSSPTCSLSPTLPREAGMRANACASPASLGSPRARLVSSQRTNPQSTRRSWFPPPSPEARQTTRQRTPSVISLTEMSAREQYEATKRMLAEIDRVAGYVNVAPLLTMAAGVACFAVGEAWRVISVSSTSAMTREIASLEKLLQRRQDEIDAARVDVVAKRQRCADLARQREERRRRQAELEALQRAEAAAHTSSIAARRAEAAGFGCSETKPLMRELSQEPKGSSTQRGYAARCRAQAASVSSVSSRRSQQRHDVYGDGREEWRLRLEEERRQQLRRRERGSPRRAHVTWAEPPLSDEDIYVGGGSDDDDGYEEGAEMHVSFDGGSPPRRIVSFPGIPGDVWRRMDDGLSSSSIGSMELNRLSRRLDLMKHSHAHDGGSTDAEDSDGDDDAERGSLSVLESIGVCTPQMPHTVDPVPAPALPPSVGTDDIAASAAATVSVSPYTVSKYTVQHAGDVSSEDDEMYGTWEDAMYLPTSTPTLTPPREMRAYLFPRERNV